MRTNEKGESIVYSNLPIPLELHAQTMKACETTGMSLRQYIFQAMRDRNQLVMPENPDDPNWVPPGLR